MVDLSPSAISRKARTKGGLVTIATVLALVAAIGATWFGLSADDHADANFDASVWLWSNTQGELARVNGITGKTDTRQAVPNSKGHPIELSQSDRYLILRDISTGKVSSFDPATLSITSTMDSQQGVGIRIALHNNSAFIVDPAQGVVRQLDPATLQPVGEALRFPPGITGGAFDGKGRLWIGIPSEGTVTSITPAPSSKADGGQGGSGGPVTTRTESVATPWHDLSLSALDNGVAVLDQTNGKVVALRDDVLTTVSTDAAGGQLPVRTGGDVVPVTVVDGRHVYLITGSGDNPKVTSFTVPGNGKLQPAVAWAGRLYIADDTNGVVYGLDAEGKLVNTIRFKVPGPLQLEVRENHLFINSPGSSIAHVINDRHEDKEVDKFRNEILGGDPPVIPPPPAQEPVITKPGAPKNIKASAGDNQVTLTWAKAPDNGSKITKYIVTGNGQTWEVGANQRTLVITALVNGQEYVFGVSAVNGKGQGPEGKSNKVTPTRDVPDPPTNVTATALPNGTVEVKWDPANGQGRKITSYGVNATSVDGAAAVGATNGDNRLIIPDKELDYGKQYAFSVVTFNDLGAGSKASTPLSNTVVPFNKPSAVKNLQGRTVTGSKGTVQFVWGAAEDNGRPITGYEVVAGGRTTTVTATNATLNGFGDGQIITGTVTAINLAGKGPAATATAKTIAPPTVTGVVKDADPGYNNADVKFAYTDGGGTVTCTLTVNGSPRTIPCSAGAGPYVLGGLWPGNTYNYTVKVANDAGSAISPTISVTTDELWGKVNCDNTNAYGDPSYCNGGIGVYSNSRQQTGESRGDARDEDRFRAWCKKAGLPGNQSGDATLNAVAYNQYKTSSWWVQITFRGGQNYIPWIWFNMDGGDNLDMLPTCS